MTNEPLLKVMIGLVNKGIRLRFITKLTQENISYCKLLMKYSSEVFHEDSVKGNFSILDGSKYMFYVVNSEEEKQKQGQKQIIEQVLYNEDKPFVDAQQYLFDNLCSNAIHAKEMVRNIERGIRGDFIDTLRNHSEIQKIAMSLLESASYEILVLFSTINSFSRADYSVILNSLWQASQRGVIIRILMQAGNDDNQLSDVIQKINREKELAINVQYITKPLENNIASLVIDQAVSLAIEINDDDRKKTFDENTVVAIYSNNESTVSSCISIFETLWMQSELDKQNKVKHAYFQIFKGFKLKDESYHRNWSAPEKTTDTWIWF
jgi:hypothetical protein